MVSYFDNSYGADADGNRGVGAWDFQLENTPQEKSEIADQILQDIREGKEVSLDRHTATLWCSASEESVEIEVPAIDYLSLVLLNLKREVNGWKELENPSSDVLPNMLKTLHELKLDLQEYKMKHYAQELIGKLSEVEIHLPLSALIKLANI